MYNIINNHAINNHAINNHPINNDNLNGKNEYTLIDLLPKKDETNMKSELKNFLKSQLSNANTSNNFESYTTTESMGNSYSNY
jgi:hypothetical protein